jgi:hypothetical protein
MPLFQASVLKKFISQQDVSKIDTAYTAYSAYFHDGSIQENIRISKEEQFQEGFLRELFVAILGYTLNPTPNFNLTTEYKNVKDSKKADGANLNLMKPAPLAIKHTEPSKKLQDWYVLSYADFIKELAKKKVKLTLSEEAEWEDYFETESKKAQELKAQIDATDKAIDTMVYELYGLSEEEILIVENS